MYAPSDLRSFCDDYVFRLRNDFVAMEGSFSVINGLIFLETFRFL